MKADKRFLGKGADTMAIDEILGALDESRPQIMNLIDQQTKKHIQKEAREHAQRAGKHVVRFKQRLPVLHHKKTPHETSFKPSPYAKQDNSIVYYDWQPQNAGEGIKGRKKDKGREGKKKNSHLYHHELAYGHKDHHREDNYKEGGIPDVERVVNERSGREVLTREMQRLPPPAELSSGRGLRQVRTVSNYYRHFNIPPNLQHLNVSIPLPRYFVFWCSVS